jgi:hypothetical protein
MPNRAFLNLFQAYPRAVSHVDWAALLVSDAEFTSLRQRVDGRTKRLKVNWLDHATLDRLYVMVMPDGFLTIPSGPAYPDYGRFLDVGDLEDVLARAEFDAAKHNRHARGWTSGSRLASSAVRH